MQFFLKYFLVIAILHFATAYFPAFAQQHVNAVIPADFADPSIIRNGKQYYAVGTSSEWAPHFPVYTSANLKDWKQTGYVFDRAPEWTSGSFWAPEYYHRNGLFYIYYTARRKTDQVSCIGVATSKFPDKGFVDHGIIIEKGKEAIDAFIYDDNGQLYITYKAYGLDGKPIEILGSKLSTDGLRLQGESFSLFKDVKGIGLEGQSILKKDDYYYLFYSSGNCCGSNCDYNVRVARSKTLNGQFEVYNKNPLLSEQADWKCSGHGTFVNTPAGRTYYLYHAYNKQSSVFTGREGLLSELIWPGKNEWPGFKTEAVYSIKKPNAIIESFNGTQLANYWQWDFRNSTPIVKQDNGNLYLSGAIKNTNQAGIVLTVRPSSTNFEMATTVVDKSAALKGLVYYGDANACIGIGTRGDVVEFWQIKDNKKTILAQDTNLISAPVHLKLVLTPDLTCKVYYRQGKKGWKQLSTGSPLKIDFLPQWDRSPRIGLNFNGKPGQDATFSDFSLTYL
jgi:beta-xylosidase